MVNKRILGLLLLLLVGCTAVAEPTIKPTATPIVIPTSELRDRTLRLFWWQAPQVVNPHLTSATADRDAARMIYEPLASFNADGELVPVLAAEIPSFENDLLDPDLKWVRWTIPVGLSWSDGRAFTAHDVKFTYDFIKSEGAVTASTYNAVDSVEVVDLQTVQVNFKDTNPAWALPFVGTEGMIIPGHIFSETGDAPTPSVGTGPYQLVSANTEEVLFLGSELVTTVKLIYEVNPYYRGADELYFRRVEMQGGGTAVEAASAVLQFGDVDFAYNLQLEGDVLDNMVAEGNGVGRLMNSLGGRVEFVSLIQNDPNDPTYQTPHPFLSVESDASNLYVAQAIAQAIDKEAIAALYGPTGAAANAILFAPANFRSEQNFYPYDLEEARQLLAQAGWADSNGNGIVDKNGRELSLTLRTGANALRQETQRLIQQSLSEIGVDLKLDVSGQFFSTNATIPNSLWAGTADMPMFTNGNQTPDPTSYMREWTCARIPQDTEGSWVGVNVARWCSEVYDALYTQVVTETDPAVREQLFKQMNDMLVENGIVIPLISRARVSGVSNQIEGVELTDWDSHLWNVHEWRRRP
ncbi:MAG: peptide ABC transporter substrate-binding protein [Anaerolineae bacterium]|nr:peptide ABC transporter substrate-binding protein [Anaerolineae bacterium]